VVGLFLGFLYARRDNAEESGTKETQRKEGNGEATPRVAGHWQNREKRWLFNENDNIDVNEIKFPVFLPRYR